MRSFDWYVGALCLGLLACGGGTPGSGSSGDAGSSDDACAPHTWYADVDGDGYGDPAATMEACEAPTGYVATGDDCNDRDENVHPGAGEVCNGIDDDCDGETDEGLPTVTYYIDCDGDGYSPTLGGARTSCRRPPSVEGCGWTWQRPSNASSRDCDDGEPRAHPGLGVWYTSPYGSGSFDYNCNGTEEKRYTHRYMGCSSSCTGSGWRLSVPACGQQGLWYGCRRLGGICRVTSLYRTQACR